MLAAGRSRPWHRLFDLWLADVTGALFVSRGERARKRRPQAGGWRRGVRSVLTLIFRDPGGGLPNAASFVSIFCCCGIAAA